LLIRGQKVVLDGSKKWGASFFRDCSQSFGPKTMAFSRNVKNEELTLLAIRRQAGRLWQQEMHLNSRKAWWLTRAVLWAKWGL
jgi:hypothetical protein